MAAGSAAQVSLEGTLANSVWRGVEIGGSKCLLRLLSELTLNDPEHAASTMTLEGLAGLAGGAPSGAAGVQDSTAHDGAAAVAGFSGSSVAVQLVLVSALLAV